MNKLENKSGNLKEILCAIADGKEVQFKDSKVKVWIRYDPSICKSLFISNMLEYRWRIKPDACREWVNVIHGRLYNGKGTPSSSSVELALIDMWNAAMEHKQ